MSNRHRCSANSDDVKENKVFVIRKVTLVVLSPDFEKKMHLLQFLEMSLLINKYYDNMRENHFSAIRQREDIDWRFYHRISKKWTNIAFSKNISCIFFCQHFYYQHFVPPLPPMKKKEKKTTYCQFLTYELKFFYVSVLLEWWKGEGKRVCPQLS